MPTLCTLDTVKHLVNQSAVDSTHDGVLIGLLEATERRFTEECGWSVTTASYTEHFAGNGRTERTFDLRPVTQVASLSAQNSFADDTWTPIDASDYKLRASAGRSYLTYPAGFGCGRDYRVIFTAGYADEAIPQDIQHLIATFTAIAFYQLEKGGKGLLPHQLQKAVGDKGITGSDVYNVPDRWWRDVIRRYRRIAV